MSYAMHYLVQFLIFGPLTIIMYSLEVQPEFDLVTYTPEQCPESAEGALDNLLQLLQLGQYLYIGCTVLSLLIFILSRYFSGSFLPGDFGKLGRMNKCAGFLLRASVAILTLAHWVLFVPVAYLLLIYFTASECYSEAMGIQDILFLLVPIVWLV